jgi:NACalpha-BTF3-like transcription factor
MARGDKEDQARMGQQMGGAKSAEKEVVQKKYDEQAVAERFKKLNDEVAAKKASEAKKEADLAKVAVKPEDVDLVSEQLGLNKTDATRQLRLHGGDAEKLFKAIVAGKGLKA